MDTSTTFSLFLVCVMQFKKKKENKVYYMHENISNLKMSTAAPGSVPLRTAGLKETSILVIVSFTNISPANNYTLERSLKTGIRIGSSFLHACQCIINIVSHIRIYTVSFMYIVSSIKQHYTPRHYESKKIIKNKASVKVIQTCPSISVNHQRILWPLWSLKC